MNEKPFSEQQQKVVNNTLQKLKVQLVYEQDEKEWEIIDDLRDSKRYKLKLYPYKITNSNSDPFYQYEYKDRSCWYEDRMRYRNQLIEKEYFNQQNYKKWDIFNRYDQVDKLLDYGFDSNDSFRMRLILDAYQQQKMNKDMIVHMITKKLNRERINQLLPFAQRINHRYPELSKLFIDLVTQYTLEENQEYYKREYEGKSNEDLVRGERY